MKYICELNTTTQASTHFNRKSLKQIRRLWSANEKIHCSFFSIALFFRTMMNFFRRKKIFVDFFFININFRLAKQGCCHSSQKKMLHHKFSKHCNVCMIYLFFEWHRGPCAVWINTAVLFCQHFLSDYFFPSGWVCTHPSVP